MGFPLVVISAKPLAMFIIASVTMNAGILTFVMKNPSIRPITVPIRTPARSAGTRPQPDLAIKAIDITPESATTDPTDRSMPPSRITYVMPNAIIPFVDICCRTFMIFLLVKNADVAKDKTTHNATKATRIPRFLFIAFMAPPLMMVLLLFFILSPSCCMLDN